MTFIFEPQIKLYVDFMGDTLPNDTFKENLRTMDKQLEDIMKKNNFSAIEELYDEVAVR